MKHLLNWIEVLPFNLFTMSAGLCVGLAPTNSTTATLALGDALAITLSVNKKFTREDFGVFHPGGSLGKKLQEERE